MYVCFPLFNHSLCCASVLDAVVIVGARYCSSCCCRCTGLPRFNSSCRALQQASSGCKSLSDKRSPCLLVCPLVCLRLTAAMVSWSLLHWGAATPLSSCSTAEPASKPSTTTISLRNRREQIRLVGINSDEAFGALSISPTTAGAARPLFSISLHVPSCPRIFSTFRLFVYACFVVRWFFALANTAIIIRLYRWRTYFGGRHRSVFRRILLSAERQSTAGEARIGFAFIQAA